MKKYFSWDYQESPHGSLVNIEDVEILIRELCEEFIKKINAEPNKTEDGRMNSRMDNEELIDIFLMASNIFHKLVSKQITPEMSRAPIEMWRNTVDKFLGVDLDWGVRWRVK